MYPNLGANTSNDQQFRLNKIKKLKIILLRRLEKENKTLSKYIASFEYFDKSLILLSVANGSISIASFATVIRAPVGIMSAGCSLVFSITTGFVKKFL